MSQQPDPTDPPDQEPASAHDQACTYSSSDDPQIMCGAHAATGQRCLAHLGSDERGTYLATLVPGSDINASGVQFTSDLLAELLQALRNDDGIPQFGTTEFGGATFTGDVWFNDATFTGDAGFNDATFTAAAGFNDATFTGAAGFSEVMFTRDAWFSGATFTGDAWFNDATCTGSAWFNEATFSMDARFSGAMFSGSALFSRATFIGDAWFNDATFTGAAWFNEAMFSGSASFSRATFTGDAWFNDATFSRSARVAGRAGTLGLEGAVVEEELQVEVAAGEVNARKLRSRGRVGLRLRAARVDLTGVVCAGPMSVHSLQQPITGVHESGLADPSTGTVPPVRVTSLRATDVGQLVLTDIDLSDCVFTGLNRADQIHLDGRCTFATDPRRRRRVLAEEHHWRAQHRQQRGRRPGRWSVAPDGAEVAGPARLEVLYRQLRKALEDGKNEPGAADFYYGEMEMRRGAARGAERVLLWLYWLTSGYGLRAGRAFLALVMVVAALAVGMQYAGFPGPPVAYLDALLYSLRSTVAVDVNSAAVPEEVTRWGQIFRILLRITGPLLVGLAALAIRNRVKR